MSLLRIYLVAFLSDIVIGIYFPTFPLYAKSIGASVLLLSIVVSVGGIANMLSHIYFGSLADRIGRMPVQKIGLIFFIAFPLSIPLIRIPELLIIPSLLQGLGVIAFSMGMTYVGDVAKPDQLDKKMGMLMVSQGIGLSIGPFIGGYVVEVWGFAPAYYLASALSVVALLVSTRIHEERMEQRTTKREPLWSKGKQILRRRSILALSLMGVIMTLDFRGVTTYLPLRGAEIGMGGSLIGVVIGVRTIFSTLARLPAGYVARIIGRKPLLTLSIILAALSYTLIGISTTFESILFAVIFEGVGFGIFLTVSRSFIMATTGRSERGTTLGVYNAVTWPGQTVLLITLGTVSELSGLATLFLAGSIITLLLGLPASYLLHKAKEEHVTAMPGQSSTDTRDESNNLFPEKPNVSS